MSGFDVSLPSASERRGERSSDGSPRADIHPDFGDSAPLTILTVCTGNICRSPMAETLLRARLATLGVRVHSAGTRALVGETMTPPAQELALAHGAAVDDVAAHRARWMVEEVAEDADLILAMSREHRTAAVELAPRSVRRAFTVREFARLAASLSDDEIRSAAESGGTTARARLFATIALVAAQRGVAAPAAANDDDVIDPYRRSRAVYQTSANQLVPAVDEVVRVLRAALS